MPRQPANRPTNTDYSSLLLDFTGVDFNGNKAPQEAQQEEPGFLSKLASSGEAILEGIGMLPGGIVDTVRDAWGGGDIDVTDRAELERRAQRERENEEYIRKYQGKTLEGIPEAMISLPYGVATMGASLGAGAAALPAGPVVAGAAGLAASGTLAYRATKEDFMWRMLGEAEKALGRMPTQEEWDRIVAEFDAEATELGRWEAGTQALSNLFMAKLLGPLGSKIFKGGMGQAAKRFAGLHVEEQAEETFSGWGEGDVEARLGLRDKAPTVVEAFKEQAPATFWQTMLMAGGKKTADLVANRMRRRSDEAASNAINPAAPFTEEELAAGLSGPTWKAEAPRMSEEMWNREAAARGFDHLRTDLKKPDSIDVAADADFLIEQGRAPSVRYTPMLQALEAGSTIDLLQLPQDASGMAQGIHMFGLPEGTGAQAMGTNDTGLGPIATPTEYYEPSPIATPYQARQAQPQMEQGLASPAPAAPAAQRQGTEDFLRNHVMVGSTPSAGPQQRPHVTPQVQPEWNYTLPSFVTAQYQQAVSEAQTKSKESGTEHPAKPHESRVELLRQLPPESRKEARRLSNAQLRDRVRAEQNPVKFDGDAIGYTDEDYPMPTAPGGTVFTSAGGRRLAPFPQVDYSTPRKHKASNARVAAWLLDEARKEAAHSEWRSLLLRDKKADNLSPADVQELVNILSNGVEKDAQPSFLKSFPAETERKSDAKEKTGKEDGKEAVTAAPQAQQQEKSPQADNNEEKPFATASEAGVGVVESEKTAQEQKHGRNTLRRSAKQRVVDEQVDLAPGLQTGPDKGDVEQPEPRKAAERSGRGGHPRPESLQDAGRDAGGRQTGNDRGSDMPVGDGLPGRGHARRDARGNSELGGKSDRVSSRDGGRADGDNQRAVKSGTGNNHHIAEDDVLVPGGAAARAKANIAAIRLVKQLEKEGRPATPAEKKILTQFTGRGSLAQTVFNPDFVLYARLEGRGGGLPPYLSADAVSKYRKWKSQYGEALHPDLGGLLTEKEWAAAEKSTLNAHYTDRRVISVMWEMAEKLGFRGGRVLEPSAGTGLFFGLMPERLAQNSSLAGVELDEMTGKILTCLYPDADIQITGFEKAKRLGDNSVDLVISNVPFGNYPVFDKARPHYGRQSIHNYFFSRALDVVRPGGLVMQITSHYTLDSGSTAKLREAWSRKADLVGAARLPGTAFEKNAGTEVTTDILIFRKKSDSRFELGRPFRNVVPVTTKSGDTVYVNEYFAATPVAVLGEHSLSGSMYGDKEYAVLPNKDIPLENELRAFMVELPADVYGADAGNMTAEQSRAGFAAQEGSKEGALVLENGAPYFVVDGHLEIPAWAEKKRRREQAQAYVGVKDAALRLISAMNVESGNERVDALRGELNAVYDAYVKKFGPINKRGNGFLEEDIEFPTVAALELVTREPVDTVVKSGKNKGRVLTI
ncbi:hypothetical protein [Desulfovibrio sp. ZJ369]|uniref:hypothetical protein n=1 Tax=Desulfovibrio sp. ZJ369 TaxID=2709793 RepID=UPI0013ECF807|nr:hypothetical protein [Desulfovibrio sp. ZJ369]